MTTDPGDLVLDPTCGSGTTAYVAEQWGRRWITIDTSRVALALARARIMGARYPYYLLSDSVEGQQKEAEVTRRPASDAPAYGDLRQGFVYERVPHITLRDIANNAEIDVIWERFQEQLEPLREMLNEEIGESWEEWEIPREAAPEWPDFAKQCHADWWELRIARQREIDASIAAKAEFEYLYDKPYEDRSKVRVAGPFTVESLSPHRVLGVDEDDELIDGFSEANGPYQEPQDFATVMLDNLRRAGVQQAHKEDRIEFSSLKPLARPLHLRRGPLRGGGQDQARRHPDRSRVRHGLAARPLRRRQGDGRGRFRHAHRLRLQLRGAHDRVLEAGQDSGAQGAHESRPAHGRRTQEHRLGQPLRHLRRTRHRHLPGGQKSDDAETGGAGRQLQVKVNGVDVFDPSKGEVRSDGPDGIACWFIDTDYNGESFFVRHAYFLGANDPYKSLKTTLKAEIDEEAWSTLNSDTSRPFDPPESGRIAVKVINHLGDEVMKVFRPDQWT